VLEVMAASTPNKVEAQAVSFDENLSMSTLQKPVA
jgi:hypothetical protein